MSVASKEFVISVREALGLTQAQFGQLFDVHPMTVSKWERDKLEPSPYQQQLMLEFKKAAEKEDVKNDLVKTMVGAGVIAALVYLLVKSK